jgi:O-antigen/teichoic acid export membrane protein
VSEGVAGVKPPMKRLLVNTFVYTLGEVALQILTVVFMPLLTRFLSPGDLGRYSLVTMVVSVLAHVYNPALHGAVTRFYYEHEQDAAARRRFQGTIVTFLLGWGALLTLVYALIGPLVLPRVLPSLDFASFGWFIPVIAGLGVLGVVPTAAWAASERSKAFIGATLLSSTVNLGGSLLFVAVFGMAVHGLLWGRTLSLSILAIPYLIYISRHIGLSFDRALLARALRFSVPLVPHLLAHWVLNASDRWLIERHGGTAAVGIYVASYAFIDAVNLLASSMNRAWVPIFTRSFADRSQHPLVARSITYFVVVVAGVATTLTVLSPTLVQLFFAPAYAAAADLAPVLALGGLAQGLYYVYVAVLFFHARNGILPVITIFAGVINVVLNLIWLPSYGILGAAWATLIGYLVLVIGVRAASRRIARLPFETARLTRLALVCVAVIAAGLAIDRVAVGWAALGVKIALLLLGAGALFAMGFFARPEPAAPAGDSGASPGSGAAA